MRRSVNRGSASERAGRRQRSLSSPHRLCEALEGRQLLAAISWDGGAGNNLWHSANNWSTNTVPTATDDVTIDVAGTPTIVFNASSGSRTVNSLLTREAIQFAGGVLTVNTTATIDGGANVQLQGGTLTGGAWSITSGEFLTTSSGGDLNSTTLNFDLMLSATSAAVTLSGTTSVAAIRLIGASTNLRLAAGYTLNAPVTAQGTASGTRTITLAPNGNGTNTIGPSGSIRLLAGVSANLDINQINTATLVNNGTIANEAAGRTLNILPGTFTNSGVVSAIAGTVSINPTFFNNSGTLIGVTGSLDIDGEFNATGTVQTLNASTGSWNIRGAVINGGTFDFSDGQGLLPTSAGGTLNNVTINGDLNFGTNASLTISNGTINGDLFLGASALLTMSNGTINGDLIQIGSLANASLNGVTVTGDLLLTASGTTVTVSGATTFAAARLSNSLADLRLAAGYTLRSLVSVEGLATGTREVTVVGGTATIAPTGSIRLSALSAGDLTIVDDSTTTTLVNNGLISVDNDGRTLSVSSQINTFVNNGTLQAAAGTVTLSSAYSNAGTIAVIGGTLALGGSFDITAGIGTWSRAGGSVNVTGSVNNAGSTLTLNASTGSWNLAGGTMTGGVITFAGSSLIPTSSGTLSGVTVIGEVVLGSNAIVTLSGASTFTAARLTGGGAELRLAAGSTLNGPVIADGLAAGTRTVIIASDTSGTVTIGPSGSIRLLSECGGDLTITDSASGTLLNFGLISAEAVGRALTISSGLTSFRNAGTVSIQAGATLNLDSGFNTIFGIGTWANTGGTVNFGGNVTNDGRTFALNAATGSWFLDGGTIVGGTIEFQDGQTLRPTAAGGTLRSVDLVGNFAVSGTSDRVTLDGVRVLGDVLLSGNTAVLTILGNSTFHSLRHSGTATAAFAAGYVLRSAIISEGSVSGTRNIVIASNTSGSFTIAPSGSISIAAGSGGNLTIDDTNAGTLVNLGSIFSGAEGRNLTITSTTFVNQSGAIGVANNATLTLGGTLNTAAGIGTWTNLGGTVNVTGTLRNEGTTLTLNASTGSWRMFGGRIDGGTLAFADGRRLLASASGGTLDGVNVLGDLLLSEVNSALALRGQVNVPAIRLQNSGTSIAFERGSVITSPIIAEGTAAGSRTVTDLSGGTGPVIIGSSGSIRLAPGTGGNLVLTTTSGGTIVNDGLIINEALGRAISITAATFTNNGKLAAAGGNVEISAVNFTNFSDTTLSGGVYSTSSGGTFAGTFASAVEVLDATVIQGGTGASWPVIVGLTQITSTGELILGDGSFLEIAPSDGAFVNYGRISLGAGSRLTVQGSVTLTQTSLLQVVIAGNSSGDYGQIVAMGDVIAGGALEAELAGGFQPAAGDSQQIITTGTLSSGQFTSTSVFTPANPLLRARVLNVGNGFSVVTTLPIDLDGNNEVDFNDFLIFFNGFNALDPIADVDGSGAVDFGDFLLFMNIYDQA